MSNELRILVSVNNYSVHTNRESLARGEARIREVRDEMRRAGRV